MKHLPHFLAAAALGLAACTPAAAITFTGSTTAGASVVADYSDIRLISFDLDLADAHAVRLDYTLTSADIGAPLSFNAIARNLTGTGLNDLYLTLGNADFGSAGTVTRHFGGDTSTSLGDSWAHVHFTTPEYLDTFIGNPLLAQGALNWTIDTTGMKLGDQLSVTIAIPEPGTYAMMLAGLGLLGWTTRRVKS